MGEVGLSGEVRSVAHLNRRLHEAAKLGFRRAIVPRTHARGSGMDTPQGLEIVRARTLSQALEAMGTG